MIVHGGILMIFMAILGTLISQFPIKAEPKGDPANWVVASDIPQAEWSHATVTSYDLTLDSVGNPVSCIITNPSGSGIIDNVVCSSMMRRSHYRPAKDATGNPISSVNRDHVQWHPEASGTSQYLRDLPDVVVSDNAASSKSRFDLVKVIEIMNVSGSVESCEVYKPSKNEKMNGKACAIISRSDISKPILDASKRPVRGVRSFNVGFIVGVDNQIFVR